MTFTELKARLLEQAVRLRRDGDSLVIHCDGELDDGELLAGLREHKAALLELVNDRDWWQPEPVITPDMLTLVALGEDEIARLVAGVPCRAGRPTCRTSIRSRRCSRACCSIT